MSDDGSNAGVVQTILRWRDGTGYDYRIQTYRLPGSVHWAIVKNARGPGGSWTREWGTEAARKPVFTKPVNQIPSDRVGVHE